MRFVDFGSLATHTLLLNPLNRRIALIARPEVRPRLTIVSLPPNRGDIPPTLYCIRMRLLPRTPDSPRARNLWRNVRITLTQPLFNQSMSFSDSRASFNTASSDSVRLCGYIVDLYVHMGRCFRWPFRLRYTGF